MASTKFSKKTCFALKDFLFKGHELNVLVINPILYTSESSEIKRVSSIKDCMICDLCEAFAKVGCNVALAASSLFKPVNSEEYSFSVVWFDNYFPSLFKPNCLPFLKGLRRYLKANIDAYDLVISSEVFSLNTLVAYRVFRDKLVVWHELAKHNSIFHQIPSKFWYNVVARLFMKDAKVVARSVEARDFIRSFMRNVDDRIIEHGVNLDTFRISSQLRNQFIVCSQLIPRKQIDGILLNFSRYLSKYDEEARLFIVGDGELRSQLESLSVDLGIGEKVTFTGRLTHAELMPLLSESMALLVNTVKDNNMVSIVESIACGVPVLTSEVPYNSSYIKSNGLGIAKTGWSEDDLHLMVSRQDEYRNACRKYRESLSTIRKAESFMDLV